MQGNVLGDVRIFDEPKKLTIPTFFFLHGKQFTDQLHQQFHHGCCVMLDRLLLYVADEVLPKSQYVFGDCRNRNRYDIFI